MNTSDHQLQNGTVLEDRYVIQAVLGEGGFGITYEAYDRHIHGVVAVKELYIREYLKRNSSISGTVSLKNEIYDKAFSAARDAFINEAKILGMFNSDAAIVSISDFFLANGTAYLVMNYLEGITLEQSIAIRGCMTDKEIFEKLLPVLRVLGKVHEAGILHCDISPDNLMVMSDGSLCLIDFGASQSMHQKLDMKSVKDGYAALERWTNEEEGPWTDIYSICATAYYCITGKVPDGAVPRAYLDELRSPSEMGITVNFVLENIMMKGLAVSGTDRFRSCVSMEEALEAVFAPPGPPPKQIWKYLLAGGASAAVCIGLIIGWNKWNSYKESIKFRGIDTETVLLVPEKQMTAQDYQNAKRTVEKRIRTLAGEQPYQMGETEEGNLNVTLPVSVFEGEDIESIYEYLLLTPGDIVVNSGWVTGDNYVNYNLNREDIQKIKLKKDITAVYDFGDDLEEEYSNYQYIEIEVSEEAAEKIWDTFSPKFEKDSAYLSVCSTAGYKLVPGEDRHTFCVLGFKQEGNFPELIKCILENDSFEKNFHLFMHVSADWEKKEENGYEGEFQCDEDEIQEPYVILAYNARSTQHMTKGEWVASIQCVKQRLDLCEIPYALGFSDGNELPITIKISASNYSSLLADTLVGGGVTLYNGWENSPISSVKGDIMLQPAEDGTYQMTALVSEYDQDNLADYTEDMLDRGLETLYLRSGGYYIASMEIDQPITDGRLVFDRLCIEEIPQITEQNRAAADYFCEILNYSFPVAYSLQTTMFVDENGDISQEKTVDERWHMLSPLEEIEQTVAEIYPAAEIWSENENLYLYIILNLSITPDTMDQYLAAVKTIYEQCSLGNGYYDKIYFLPFVEDESVIERARMSFRKSYSEDSSGYEVEVFFKNGRCDSYNEELKEKMAGDIFFQDFMTDSTFGNLLG